MESFDNEFKSFYIEEINDNVEINPLTGEIRYLKDGVYQYPNISAAPTEYFCFGFKGKYFKIHRLIARFFLDFDENSGLIIDHINNNRHDNRVCNLRIVSSKENARNRIPSPNKSSKYIGVMWRENRNKWRAYIDCEPRKHLGYYETDVEAAEAYDKEAIKRGYTEHDINGKNIDYKNPKRRPVKKKEIKIVKEDCGEWKNIELDNGREIGLSSEGYVCYFDRNLKKEVVKLPNQNKASGRYKRIKFDGNEYLVHRLVAKAFLGLDLNDKTKVVDHINGDGGDNRVINLRVVSYSENSKNKKPKAQVPKVKYLDVINKIKKSLLSHPD